MSPRPTLYRRLFILGFCRKWEFLALRECTHQRMETILPWSNRLVDTHRRGNTEYAPNQDQNVIQHTALIFLGRCSVVLSIFAKTASPPDFARRVLISVSSANSSSPLSVGSPLSYQNSFFHTKASQADAENNGSSSDDANLFELSGPETRSKIR